jgi:hypothetical protein
MEKEVDYELLWKVFKHDLNHQLLPNLRKGKSKDLLIGLIDVMDHLETVAKNALEKSS